MDDKVIPINRKRRAYKNALLQQKGEGSVLAGKTFAEIKSGVDKPLDNSVSYLILPESVLVNMHTIAKATKQLLDTVEDIKIALDGVSTLSVEGLRRVTSRISTFEVNVLSSLQEMEKKLNRSLPPQEELGRH